MHITAAQLQDRLAAAKKLFETHHLDVVRQIFGEEYEKNPRFEQALHEVAQNNRTVPNVLADYVTG